MNFGMLSYESPDTDAARLHGAPGFTATAGTEGDETVAVYAC
ncbi:hypothetical protein [Streptomyces sp. NPDC051219]